MGSALTGPGHAELREGVRSLCAQFDSAYWQKVDEARAYPEAFVDALTKAGWMAALIPEQYGGSGLSLTEATVIMEEISRSGGNPGCCHGQMYNMNTLLRNGSEAQKRKYLPKIASGELRMQAMGVTEPTAGTDTTRIKTVAVKKGDRYVVNGQKVWTSRLQHSELMILLARTTPLSEVAKKSDGMSVFLVEKKEALGKGMTLRPIRNMVNHETNEVFFDNLEIPAENLIGEEGRGLPLYPRRAERRAHPHRRRVHRRRLLVRRARDEATPRSASSSTARSARTRASSSRSRRPTWRSRPPT
jgi:acyl-CoA dehydrogenase